MKKSILFCGILILATFTGCDLFNTLDQGVPVKIDKTATIAADNGLPVLSEKESIVANDNGDLNLRVECNNEITVNENLPAKGSYLAVDEKLVIEPKSDLYPNEAQDVQFAWSLKNPSSKTITTLATDHKLNIDGQEVSVPGTDVPANSEVTVTLARDLSGVSGNTNLDRNFVMDDKTYDLLKSQPEKITLGGLSLAEANPALKSAAASVATKAGSGFVFNTWLFVPLKYTKGEVINIDRTFYNLGLDSKAFDNLSKNFQVEVTVSSTLPFNIKSQGKVGDSISASLDTPIAAGTPSNPVETKAVITVTSDKAINDVSSVTIHLELEATESFNLNKSHKLVIYYDQAIIKG